MRKFKLMSDLHLEFQSSEEDECEFGIPCKEDDKETVLLLAGDIGIANRPKTYSPYLENWCGQFKAVVMVMGNHEHYYGNIDKSYDLISEETELLSNFHLLENESVVIGDVTIIGATFWTNFEGDPNYNSTYSKQVAKCKMNDFELISDAYGTLFTPNDSVKKHLESLEFIVDAIKEKETDKIIVMTHHLPSFKSISPEFNGDALNPAYASDYDDLIKYLKPDTYVHGHIHSSVHYMIGDTEVMCNPRGYFPDRVNPDFKEDFSFEV